ncbi:MAG TPA: lysophospholipid acyltransferase family protein [Ktedonobacterales bacterium]|nr:lysophospholipid acyltransferase family protein [Ktedonobacterales bacterium]
MESERVTASATADMRPLWRAARARAWRWSLAAAGVLLDGVSAGAHWLPATSRYAISDGVVWALGPLLARPRRDAELNFRRVVGPERAAAASHGSLRNYGRMAMDFLASRMMAPKEILALADTVGVERLEAAMARGRGVIFALPHAGCWDVAAAFAQAYGCQLTIVTESDWGTELVAGSRRSRGVTLAPRNQSLRSLFRALRRQEFVVMLSDIAPAGVQTVDVEFFGAPAPFPVGPARLALTTGAPLMVIQCIRLPGGRYRLEAQEPLYPPERSRDSEADALAMTAAMAAGFERIIRADPEQWYPYHPVWPASAGRLGV